MSAMRLYNYIIAVLIKALFALGRKLENGAEAVLDVVGFSRGAALALHFANMVNIKGAPLPSTRKKRRKRVCNQSRRGGRYITQYKYDWVRVHVRWIGLWDAVPAMGLPDNNINIGYRLAVPKGAAVSHAMALNVSNSNFILHRVKRAHEVWFMGNHGEVGGSSGDILLSDCTLGWMAKEAVNHNVPIDLSGVTIPVSENLAAPKHKESKTRIRGRRTVLAGDLVHCSVRKAAYSKIPWTSITVERNDQQSGK